MQIVLFLRFLMASPPHLAAPASAAGAAEVGPRQGGRPLRPRGALPAGPSAGGSAGGRHHTTDDGNAPPALPIRTSIRSLNLAAFIPCFRFDFQDILSERSGIPRTKATL